MANIYTFCGYPIAALLMSLNRQVSIRKNRQKISNQICMAQRQSHKPLQRYRKFLRMREFVKNSFARIEYLCITLPDFGCTHSGFLTVWIASGEKKFRLFLFLFGDCQKLSKTRGYFATK